MRKLLFAAVAMIVMFAATGASASGDQNQQGQNQQGQNQNDNYDHQGTSATEMTLLGVTAASVLGAGAYALRRRRSKPSRN